MNKNSGQALIEMIVFVTFVIAPMMLLVPYFSKIIETQHYANMSSRYIAWERTVWLENKPGNWSGDDSSLAIKNTSQVVSDVPWRIFKGHDSVITSLQPSDSKWNDSNTAQFLNFNQASQTDSEFLLAPFNPTEEDDTLHNYFSNDLKNNNVPGTIASAISMAFKVLEIGGLDLEQKGFYHANFSTQVTSHKLLEFINEDIDKEPENENAESENKRPHQFEFPITSDSYILASGWNVGGQSHNENRVRSLVPSNLFNIGVLDSLRDAVSEIPIMEKLNSNSLKFGHIEIEELPTSRKGNNIDGSDK
ncbi:MULTISPECIES: hypothetical protein [Pseudoalteromonas]|uniref:Uncharacterized protein n=1 Tax=Pseudoalteromonas arctica A 37-1-2 TaxID=1117313 RepID=A0A290S3G0_9GAMM|nr:MULTISPECIES: hypothetical protein [Pseudoalteromonas]ATC86459.1 hypothetical protein PARC_a1904 [Pseudoalteromonas arctica A 37-1-2]MBH0001966.1 hypothetical protein [Pseudoalteromonas sp. SWYJZ12]